MMRRLVFFIILFSCFQSEGGALNGGGEMQSFVDERRFFGLAMLAGLTKSSLQNADGSEAGYQAYNLGAELELPIWGEGAGRVSLIGSYLFGEGTNNTNKQNKLKSETALLGLRIGLGRSLYVSAATGTNRLNLSSSDTSAKLGMKHSLMRASVGADFPVSENIYLGVELSYQTGSVKRNDNSQLTENTSFDGVTGLVKMIWSPSSIIVNYFQKR
ncbi:MAG: hypothetical protein KF789_11010 [Bdellovibrionaceae bacterium]|nr:hypothetical protein [Pseudobdellovibrionaceae bacterium]